MTKHTPGPWVAEYIDGTTDQFVGTQQEMVARVTGSMYDGDAHANARLIASAPTLLEALHGLLAMPTHDPDAWALAEAAYFAATGAELSMLAGKAS